jgi:hypothetical protein
MEKIIQEIAKNQLLFFIAIGLGFCFIAALGSWPGSQSPPMETGWRIGLGFIGLIMTIGCAPAYWRQLSNKSPFSLEGEYYAEGVREYQNTITHVSDNIYQIKGHSWDGVGLVEGNYYYGIYKYTDNPDCAEAGNWGAHRGEIRFNELPIVVIDLADRFETIGRHHRWEKAK